MHLKEFINLVKTTFQEWSEDKASRLAAALSYYTVFSLAPLLIIAIAIAGYFFGQSNVQDQVMAQIASLMGERGAETVRSLMESTQRPGGTLVATVVGLVTLALGASGVFGQLQDSLNTIWEVEPDKQGIWGTVKKRFFSFTLVLGIGFLLLVSLIISTALSALNNFVNGLLPGTQFLLQVTNLVVSFGIITLLFALIYKYIPDVEVRWTDVWIGAAVTAVLFTIGKWAIGLYLGNVSSTYGAAGSLVIVLLWVYYSSQILFLGAEFTQVYANQLGEGVKPGEGAHLMAEEARRKQGMTRLEGVGDTQRPVERPHLGREQTAYEAKAGVKAARMAAAGVPVTGEDYTSILATQEGAREKVDPHPKPRKFVPLRAFASVAGFFKVLGKSR
jgi:membrane protein